MGLDSLPVPARDDDVRERASLQVVHHGLVYIGRVGVPGSQGYPGGCWRHFKANTDSAAGLLTGDCEIRGEYNLL